jgi:transcriptional regulator with XRE-family HTH domain
MKFRDKLFQLRKKRGLTQDELAEALNVSRQAVSKWEMGTAVPDTENMLALSKLFGVSLDYLINDDIKTEMDTPIVKATASIFKINYQYIITRLIIASCVIATVSIIGVLTRSFFNMLITLLVLGTIFLIYYGLRLFMLYRSNRK